MNFSISNKTRSYVVFLPNIYPEDLVQRQPTYDVQDDTDLFSEIPDTARQDSELDLDDLMNISSSWSNKFDTTTDDLELIPATSVIEPVATTFATGSITPDEMPRQFYNLDRVPTNINLSCWGCGSRILNRPWQLPVSVDRSDVEPGEQEQDFSTSKELHLDLSDFRKQQQMDIIKRARQIKIMKTHGIFCHVWCIGRYLKYPIDVGINRWQSSELLKEMFKIREGRELIDIPVSESPYIMARYCGPSGISEDEYYNKNLKNLANYVRST
jgi:hypothetical protein